MKSVRKKYHNRRLTHIESASARLWLEILKGNRFEEIETVIPFMPDGNGLQHAEKMQKIVKELGWGLWGIDGGNRLTIAYGKQAIESYIQPFFERIFSTDMETIHWIMMPEHMAYSVDSEFFARCPENAFRLWVHVDTYFRGRFPGYPKGKGTVSSLYYFSQCCFHDAVKWSSIAFMEETATDCMSHRTNIHAVKRLEALSLMSALQSCGVWR